MKIGSFQDNCLLWKLLRAACATGRCQRVRYQQIAFPTELSPVHLSLHKSLFPRAEPVGGLVLGVNLAASLGSSGTPVDILILP